MENFIFWAVFGLLVHKLKTYRFVLAQNSACLVSQRKFYDHKEFSASSLKFEHELQYATIMITAFRVVIKTFSRNHKNIGLVESAWVKLKALDIRTLSVFVKISNTFSVVKI